MKKNIIWGMMSTCLAILLSGCSSNKQAATPWEKMEAVEANIQLTNFPDKNFLVTDYGATADADISEALTKAIADCHAQGGGKVIVPEGTYYTKAIHLLSNVNLHISKNRRKRNFDIVKKLFLLIRFYLGKHRFKKLRHRCYCRYFFVI